MIDMPIPYGRQDISQTDIDAVVDVLKSDYLTQGPKIPSFEQALADYVGAQHAVAVNSATSALHIACLALGLSKGDWLWTSPITFVASANCGLYCGAQVDFVDIDPDTYNMCPAALERKLAQAKADGCLPKVLVPVHLAGQSADMRQIKALADAYGVAVIEDASHAIGGRYDGKPVGNCRYSDITVFSFHPVKIITTAEGGVATTNRPELAERMNLYRSHGVTREEGLMTHVPDGPWYYQQVDLGFNYRITDLQAALGLSQLQRLDEFVGERNRLAQRYHQILELQPLKLPLTKPDCYSALHLFPVLVEDASGASRRALFEACREAGVLVNVHYIPVHLQPYYQSMGFAEGDFPVAENYYKRALSLPLFPNLTEAQQDFIRDTIAEFVKA